MLSSYIVIAFRNLARQKLYTLINVLGLAVGMACCIIAMLVIRYEIGFDRFHEKADRIVRVLRERGGGAERQVRWLTSGALARAIEQEIPEVERATKARIYSVKIKKGDRDVLMRHGQVDENFFDVFTFPFVSGNPGMIDQPYVAAITRSAARTLFGDSDPVGRTVTIEERYYGGDYRIVAVIADPPGNSSIGFDVLHRTMARTEEGKIDWNGWQSRVQQAGIETHLLLREGADPAALERKLPDFIERHMGAEARETITYRLQPVLRRRLFAFDDYGPNGTYGVGPQGDIQTVYSFAAVALFILVIAVVNYTNLATARSMRRAREVGLRKVMGADRGRLVSQFLGESILLTGVAAAFATLFARAALPRFNQLFETNFTLGADAVVGLLPWLLPLVLLVGLTAGLYPAFFLSGFQPSRVLKSTTGSQRLSGANLRKSLVVLQFAISVLLIVGTAFVYKQLAFISAQKLGFDAEQFVVLPLFRVDRDAKTNNDPWLAARYNVIRNEFLQVPGVTAATAFRSLPGDEHFFVRIVKPEGHEGSEWRMPVLECDESFFDAFGIPMLAGRTFSPDIERDRGFGWIINRAAVDALGWAVEDAVGKRFGRARGGEDANGEVIGVIENFHIKSLHEPIGPQAFGYRQWFFDYMGLRMAGDIPATMNGIEATWKKLMRPDQPFTFQFMDDVLDAQYREERRIGSMIGSFSLLAIFLACMGLFGLSAFSAEQRIREIGIRKTLGASVPGLLALVASEFLQLVAIGCVVAWPLAWYATRSWLDTFAYRTDLDLLTFLGGGLLAAFIALITVGGHALRAARTDPVDTLRYE